MSKGHPYRLHPALSKVAASDVDEALKCFFLPCQLDVAGQLIYFLFTISADNTLGSSNESTQAPFNMPMEPHHLGLGTVGLASTHASDGEMADQTQHHTETLVLESDVNRIDDVVLYGS